MKTPPAARNASPSSAATGTNERLNLRALLRASIADTQFEVRRSHSRMGQWRAQARGYIAVVRLVLASPFLVFFTGGSMGRLLAALLLGLAGSSLVVVWFSQTDGPLQIVPFFLFAVVTPLVLRAFKLGNSYRQMFAACATVGLMMGTTSFLSVIWDRHWGAPDIPQLFGFLWRVAVMVGCMLFGSALAARIAWPAIDRRSVLGQVTSALLVGWSTFALVWFAIGVPFRYREGLGFLLAYAASSLLQAFFFAVSSGVLVVPLLLVLRRLLAGRIPLTIAGALLFPFPFLARAFIPYGSRGIAMAWTIFTSFPSILALLSWLIAAGAIGWCLAALRQPPESPTPVE